MALQPGSMVYCISSNLQQQKLLWHYSQQVTLVASPHIYNSRNYYGIIAFTQIRKRYIISTIVEIIMALQPAGSDSVKKENLQQQKLLWHYSRNHKKCSANMIYNSRNYYGIIAIHCGTACNSDLQQQKLLWHYSLQQIFVQGYQIYNSRNYYGIIA